MNKGSEVKAAAAITICFLHRVFFISAPLLQCQQPQRKKGPNLYLYLQTTTEVLANFYSWTIINHSQMGISRCLAPILLLSLQTARCRTGFYPIIRNHWHGETVPRPKGRKKPGHVMYIIFSWPQTNWQFEANTKYHLLLKTTDQRET